MRRAQQSVLQLLASCWCFQAVAHQRLAAAAAGGEGLAGPGAAAAGSGGAPGGLQEGGGWAELEAAAQVMQGSIGELGELLLEQAAGSEQLADLRARAGL
jgi:hypothetical protein